MVGRICPHPPGWDRGKVSENLGATSVAPVGLCLFILPNFSAAMFIQGATFIPDSRVILGMINVLSVALVNASLAVAVSASSDLTRFFFRFVGYIAVGFWQTSWHNRILVQTPLSIRSSSISSSPFFLAILGFS
jgi:hypothetical protein